MTVPTLPNPGNPNAPANPNPLPPVSGVIQPNQQDPNLNDAHIVVNGKSIILTLNSNVNATSPIGIKSVPWVPGKTTGVPFAPDKSAKTLQSEIGSIQTWYDNLTTRRKYIEEMYAAGLVSSKKAPSAYEVALAWQLVVQEAALQTADGNADLSTPVQVLAEAAKQGWNEINAKQALGDVGVNGTGYANNASSSSSQSQTIYKSYIDPASAMGVLADSSYRLLGRNPTPQEYQAFLNTVYNYQDEENTGKFETKSKVPGTGDVDPTTGQPVDSSGSSSGTSTQTNVVSQRQLGTGGLQFLAGQQALSTPEAGAYQAGTTYFNALIKALSGPAAGMQASGPTGSTF